MISLTTSNVRWLLFSGLFILAFLLLSNSVAAQDNINTSPNPNKDQIIERVENRRDNREEKRQNTKKRVTERHETMKEKVSTRRLALKEKLNTLKDQRKAQIAERVDKNLGLINERRTSKMADHLDKLNQIIAKLEVRIEEAAALGKDTARAQSAAFEASSAINAAQAAIEAQAGKDYGVTVSEESKLKSDVKSTRNTLHIDLKSAHDLVVAARQAVAKAISTTRSTTGGTKGTNREDTNNE